MRQYRGGGICGSVGRGGILDQDVIHYGEAGGYFLMRTFP